MYTRRCRDSPRTDALRPARQPGRAVIQPAVPWPTDRPTGVAGRRNRFQGELAGSHGASVCVHCAKTVGTSRYRPAAAARRWWRRWRRRWRRRRRRQRRRVDAVAVVAVAVAVARRRSLLQYRRPPRPRSSLRYRYPPPGHSPTHPRKTAAEDSCIIILYIIILFMLKSSTFFMLRIIAHIRTMNRFRARRFIITYYIIYLACSTYTVLVVWIGTSSCLTLTCALYNNVYDNDDEMIILCRGIPYTQLQ